MTVSPKIVDSGMSSFLFYKNCLLLWEKIVKFDWEVAAFSSMIIVGNMLDGFSIIDRCHLDTT